MNGKFYENNIVIQYDKDLIEVGQCEHSVHLNQLVLGTFLIWTC